MSGDPDFPDDSKGNTPSADTGPSENSSGMPNDIGGEDGSIFGTISGAYDSWSDGGEDGGSGEPSAQDSSGNELEQKDGDASSGAEEESTDRNDRDTGQDDNDTETDDAPPLEWTDDMDSEWTGESGDLEVDPEIESDVSEGTMPDPSYYEGTEDASDGDSRDLPGDLPDKVDGDR